MDMVVFPAELSKCKNITVKFDGFLPSKQRPLEKINDSTWLINRPELVSPIFRQLGAFISKVSVRFDGSFVPSSGLMRQIINHTATFCSTVTSFELINWRPCNEEPLSLMDLENTHPLRLVHELSIYDSEWSSVMTHQINGIYPNLRELKLLRNDFKSHDAKVESFPNLKHLEIQCQLQNKFRQNNIIKILNAQSGLEHLTLTLNGTSNFYNNIWCKQLISLSSLTLGYSRCFDEKHLAKIFKSHPHLKKLTIFKCNIALKSIVQALFINESIEKIHLINYGQTLEPIQVLGWRIVHDYNNNVLLKKM